MYSEFGERYSIFINTHIHKIIDNIAHNWFDFFQYNQKASGTNIETSIRE